MMEGHEKRFLTEVIRNEFRFMRERDDARRAGWYLFFIGIAIGICIGKLLTSIF